MSTPVSIQNLRKEFGSTVANDDISLDIPGGDLFFLLGPSGCGKTTLLRMIAGFTEPTSGKLMFGEEDVTWTPPNKRNTGMMFQGYALWPHMTVAQNVAFGLDVRKIPKAEKEQRVKAALGSVQMTEYADRKINQLSGGQQQRVALARALVIEPTVLLLDEPLSNLDAKLRLEMRQQIRDICKRVGITGIYVTHDQKEALSMADQIAVLNQGKLMQVGPPKLLYERPKNRFVADFLGETNFIPAEVRGREGEGDTAAVILDSPLGTLKSTVFPDDLPATGNVTCSIRPESIRLMEGSADQVQGDNVFTADRDQTIYLGEMAQHQLKVGDATRVKAFELNPRFVDGEVSNLTGQIDPHDVVILRD